MKLAEKVLSTQRRHIAEAKGDKLKIKIGELITHAYGDSVEPDGGDALKKTVALLIATMGKYRKSVGESEANAYFSEKSDKVSKAILSGKRVKEIDAIV